MIIEKFKLGLFLVLILLTNAGLILADETDMSVFIVPLLSPSGLSATAISYQQIDLSWSVVAGAESYNVYSSGELIASVDNSFYSVIGLEAETSYFFTVSSVSDLGESSQSLTVSAVTLAKESEIPVGGGGGYDPGSIFDNLIIPAQKKDLTSPVGGFKIVINDGVIKTNDLAISIKLYGGPDAVQVEISDCHDFKNSIVGKYVEKKIWVLSGEDGEKTVYVRFLNEDGNFSPTVSDNIILDSIPPQIDITKIKNFYGVDEDVIIGGTVNEPTEIIFYWDRKYGLIKASDDQEWTVNLGKMSVGNHSIILMAKDDVNNLKTITADILIKTQVVIPVEKPTKLFSFIPFVFENIEEKIKSIIGLASPEQEIPFKIIIVSQDTPRFLDGQWNLLPVEPLK